MPNPDFDPTFEPPPGVSSADGNLRKENSYDANIKTRLDSGITKLKPDSAVAHEKDSSAPQFGQICSDQKNCGVDEQCIFAEEGATKGICLRKCKQVNAKCLVPDPKFFSGCSTYWNSVTPTTNLCVIFCKSPDNKTFPCPNDTDYKCKLYGQMGMCVAKQ
jgi:hypothetical protein